MYDAATVNKSSKITLLSSRKINSQSKIIEETVDTVETVFEIYLCDNCEAELYSKDAYDVSSVVLRSFERSKVSQLQHNLTLFDKHNERCKIEENRKTTEDMV